MTKKKSRIDSEKLMILLNSLYVTNITQIILPLGSLRFDQSGLLSWRYNYDCPAARWTLRRVSYKFLPISSVAHSKKRQ